MSDERIRKVIRQIRHSFASVLPPAYLARGKDSVTEHELSEVVPRPLPSRWEDLEVSVVVSLATELPLLNALAFKYFLPACMQNSLNPTSLQENNLLEFTLYSLRCPEPHEPFHPNFLERLRGLDRGQRLTIRTYLLLIAELHAGSPMEGLARQCLPYFSEEIY